MKCVVCDDTGYAEVITEPGVCVDMVCPCCSAGYKARENAVPTGRIMWRGKLYIQKPEEP